VAPKFVVTQRSKSYKRIFHNGLIKFYGVPREYWALARLFHTDIPVELLQMEYPVVLLCVMTNLGCTVLSANCQRLMTYMNWPCAKGPIYVSNAKDETVIGKCLLRAFSMEKLNDTFIFAITFLKYLCIGEKKKKKQN
jgi:hypothetical protein